MVIFHSGALRDYGSADGLEFIFGWTVDAEEYCVFRHKSTWPATSAHFIGTKRLDPHFLAGGCPFGPKPN